MNSICSHCHGQGVMSDSPSLHCLHCRGLGFTMPEVTFRQTSKAPARGGWAPGEYLNTCRDCDAVYIGDKRSWQCDPCANRQPTLKQAWDQFYAEQFMKREEPA
jgi:DnaJ-class molecular chaperone